MHFAVTALLLFSLQDAPARCSALSGVRIGTSVIVLPTQGAVITIATPIAAAEQGVNPNGTIRKALPAYCKVIGTIAPIDPAAPKINFEVNLPDNWNRKMLGMGGGGFNGTQVTGLGDVPSKRSKRRCR